MPFASVCTSVAQAGSGDTEEGPVTLKSGAGTGRFIPICSTLAVIRSTRGSRRGPSTPRDQ